jgi:RNA polymerase sigma factor (TIGR02999 family)
MRSRDYPCAVGDITQLLERARNGDTYAHDELFQRVYPELQQLARHRLGQSSALTLLDASSLVHEAYLRLTRQQTLTLTATSRRMFFAYASKIMRSVVIDYARERRALKRGGGEGPLTLHTGDAAIDARVPDLEALDLALQELAHVDDRAHQIVEMRYFAGLSIEEIAEALDLSPATVKRGWQKARAFLFDALQPS